MIKRIFPSLVCMAGLTAHAQDMVTIKAHLKEGPNDSLVTLFEPVSNEVDTVRIKNNRFVIQKKMPKGGSVHILQIGSVPEVGGALLYLEPGEVNIENNGAYLKNAVFSGSPFIKDWEYVEKNFANAAEYKALDELEAKYHKAVAIGDEDAAQAYDKQGSLIMNKRKAAAKKWIMENPDKGVSAYLVNVYFTPNERVEMLKLLGPGAKASRIGYRMLNPGKDGLPVQLTQGKDNLPAGVEAPAFSSKDMNGKTVSLADFKGKYVFIDFWASWCSPCITQIPFLKAAYSKYKNSNFVMLGVSLDKDRAPWEKAIKRHELDWLQLSELKGWEESAAKTYEIGALPANVLIGPDGKILAKNMYSEDIEKRLSELIK